MTYALVGSNTSSVFGESAVKYTTYINQQQQHQDQLPLAARSRRKTHAHTHGCTQMCARACTPLEDGVAQQDQLTPTPHTGAHVLSKVLHNRINPAHSMTGYLIYPTSEEFGHLLLRLGHMPVGEACRQGGQARCFFLRDAWQQHHVDGGVGWLPLQCLLRLSKPHTAASLILTLLVITLCHKHILRPVSHIHEDG